MGGYPLTIETGETFLSDGQLLRFVREKCGDIASEFLKERIETDEMPLGGTDFLGRLKSLLANFNADLSELENDADAVVELINSEQYRGK